MSSIAERGQSVSFRHWLASSGVLIPTAFGVGGSLTVSLLAVQQPVWSLLVAVWLLVYASYQIDSLGELKDFDANTASSRSRYLQARKRRVVLQGVAAFLGAMLVTALHAGVWMSLSLLLFPASVVLYGMPVLRRLSLGLIPFDCVKSIPYAKSFYTAFFWGLLGVFSLRYVDPACSVGGALLVFALFAQRLFINTVFSDFKDIERDRAAGVQTPFVALGRERVLRILRALNLVTPLLLSAAVGTGALPLAALGLCATVVYAQCYLTAARRGHTDAELLCNLVADAEWLLWPLYLLIGNIIF
ncbi:MAG: UbiA family prenyltransferase [Rhodocyclaceae bacterium]